LTLRTKPAAPFVLECLVDPSHGEIREAKRRAFEMRALERRQRIREATSAVDSLVSDLINAAKIALDANPGDQYLPTLIDALEEYQHDAADATAAVGDDDEDDEDDFE
jgi:hypothetical protein